MNTDKMATLTNSQIPTNFNNENNKNDHFQSKYVDTTNNERINTVKANLNTMVQVTNNDGNPKHTKINTSVNQSL
jgi:hypothetical protein